MRFLLGSFLSCILLPACLCGQQSVCDLFKDLKAADGRQVKLSGDLIVSTDLTALGAADCDNRYILDHMQWPAGVSLRLTNLSGQPLQRYRDAAPRILSLRQGGKSTTATAVLSGRLLLAPADGFPAELTVDSIDTIDVEELPHVAQLPVVPICDLFQNLGKWKGQRIAVRGEGVGTGEGYWIGGRCKGAFETNGYRWPVSLSYGGPAYYSQRTAPLVEAKQPKIPAKGEDLFRGRQNVVNTATYIGRLRMRDKYFAVCGPGGRYATNGFGHLNGAVAELVIEEVRDVELTAWAPMPMDEEPETDACVIPDHDVFCAKASKLADAVLGNCVDRAKEILLRDGIDSKNGSESATLRSAIQLGNVELVALLLDAGAPTNPLGYDYSWPLENAARSGKIDTLRLLLKKGAQADRLNDQGETYLATFGFFDARVMTVLLDAGANPNAKDRRGQTALMNAAGYGYEDAVRILIEHKADVNLADSVGRTALMHAAAGEYVDAIPLLLAAGANVHGQDREGKSALDIAMTSKNQVAVELLSAAVSGGSVTPK